MQENYKRKFFEASSEFKDKSQRIMELEQRELENVRNSRIMQSTASDDRPNMSHQQESALKQEQI